MNIFLNTHFHNSNLRRFDFVDLSRRQSQRSKSQQRHRTNFRQKRCQILQARCFLSGNTELSRCCESCKSFDTWYFVLNVLYIYYIYIFSCIPGKLPQPNSEPGRTLHSWGAVPIHRQCWCSGRNAVNYFQCVYFAVIFFPYLMKLMNKIIVLAFEIKWYFLWSAEKLKLSKIKETNSNIIVRSLYLNHLCSEITNECQMM